MKTTLLIALAIALSWLNSEAQTIIYQPRPSVRSGFIYTPPPVPNPFLPPSPTPAPSWQPYTVITPPSSSFGVIMRPDGKMGWVLDTGSIIVVGDE